MASTPRIEANGERTRIYVGSDDNTLHGRYFDGGPVEGFPFRTGGDVFSSPWVGELDGTGKREIVFGSDDGCVYVLDTDGRLAPPVGLCRPGATCRPRRRSRTPVLGAQS